MTFFTITTSVARLGGFPGGGFWAVLNWAVLNLIVRVYIGLGGWTKFGLVLGQFGGFQTNKLFRLID